MAENNDAEVDPSAQLTKRRKPLISPTSSFVDFAELDTEIYTEDDKEAADLYDPFAHREVKKPITNFETWVHMLKAVIGAGVFTMNRAFENAGVAIGVPGSIFLGFLCIYGVHVMFAMQKLLCKRLRVPFLTLSRSLKIAFLNGPKPFNKAAWLAPYYVDFFLVANQVGLCATYVTFIATSLQSVLEPNYLEPMDKKIYMAMLFLPVLLINYIRNLKKMTPLSLLGDIFMLGALGCCFYYIFGTESFRFDEIEYVADISGWPKFISTVMFALEAIGVLIAIEHTMKSPQSFTGCKGIMPWSMIIVVSIYISLGLCSYLRFGKETKGTIIETLPQNEVVSSSAQILVALAIYGSYPLQCYVGLEIIWGNYLARLTKKYNKECLFEYIMRTAFVAVTFAIAMLVKNVDDVVSLVGAFCLSSLGLIIPFLLELCTKWPDQLGIFKYVIIKDTICIFIGISILIIGTAISIKDIILKEQNEK